MTRRKVKLEFITDDARRKLTFKKRKMGLMKKMSEIRTLCEVEACAIIFGHDGEEVINPGIYPPTRFGVQSVINRFREMPEMEQNKRMLDHPSFMNCRISKANEVLVRNNTDNMKAEMGLFIIRCLGGPTTMNTNQITYNFGMGDLMRMIEERINNIKGIRHRELQQEIPLLVANEGGEGGGGAADGVLNGGSALVRGHHDQVAGGMMTVMQQNNLDAGVQQQNHEVHQQQQQQQQQNHEVHQQQQQNHGVHQQQQQQQNQNHGVHQQQNHGVFDPNYGGGGNGAMMRLLLDDELDDALQQQDWGVEPNNGAGGNQMMPNNLDVGGVQQPSEAFHPNTGAEANGMIVPYGASFP